MERKREIPKIKVMDSTVQLMHEGYTFIAKRCQQMHTPLFKTRLLGKQVICMSGREAASLFYDEDRFKRNGAAPTRIIETLFGKNSVQTLDGRAHTDRKSMLMSAMTSEQIDQLTLLAKKQWHAAIKQWKKKETIIFYEEVQEIMCQIALAWTGLPVSQKDIKQRTKDLCAMYESASRLGPKHWGGRHARNRTEEWIRSFIDAVRVGEVTLDERMILHTFAWHRDPSGLLLRPETVAVEVLNIIRPIVAISVYINFIVLALHHNPSEKERIKHDRAYADDFVQEVRRFYPFFPFALAKTKKAFTWNGYSFEKDTLTLLDLYGTNHDPTIWQQPEQFNPDRFQTMEKDRFSLIPQGGGDFFLGHRCAGERITIELMKVSLDYLVHTITYEIPKQNLSYRMNQMPSVPTSNIILSHIRHSRSYS